jgi:hypothetical protein
MVCQFSGVAFKGAFYSAQCEEQATRDIITGVATLSFCEEHCKTVFEILALTGITFVARRHDATHSRPESA